MSDNVSLLPCPFCGQVEYAMPERYQESGAIPGWWVVCDGSGCGTRGCGAATGWNASKEEAIAAWNARPRIMRCGSCRHWASESEVLGVCTIGSGMQSQSDIITTCEFGCVRFDPLITFVEQPE